MSNIKQQIVLHPIFLFLIVFLNTSAFCQHNERNGFIGIVVGPSFPVGEFGYHSDLNTNSGYAEISCFDYLVDFGYRFGRNYGLSASYFFHQYNIDTISTDISWDFSGIVVGPMLVFPLNNKFIIDVCLNFGYVLSGLSIDQNSFNELKGHGIGMVVKGSMSYNILNRWCIIAETSYLTSNQKLKIGTLKKIQAIDMNIGIGFRL